jgi:hypothetical protein
MPFDVFLSYNRKDQDRVQLLYKGLADRGVRVWIDLSMLPGDNFHSEISTALQEVNAAIFCLGGPRLRTMAGIGNRGRRGDARKEEDSLDSRADPRRPGRV